MNNPPIKILLIEDNPGDARMVQELLREAAGGPFELSAADRLEAGLVILAEGHYDILLLDLELPDSTGMATVERALGAFPSLPVIIMSNLNDEDTATQAVRTGAQDYLIKGSAGPDLLARSIIHAIERKKSELALRDAIGQAEQQRLATEELAGRLSLLHEIGLTLNRETDKHRLLNSVLASACDLTSAGVGALVLVREGVMERVNTHFAEWYSGECLLPDTDSMHQQVGRLIEEGRDSVRLEFSDETSPFELPEGHPHLAGLLVGAIQDSRGNPRGWFMLSHKAAGASFSKEDEKIVSLLAAQSSVALTSAENLEREHAVAEALQSSLLPRTPQSDRFEIGLIYKSASPISRLGGDFYDFVPLKNGSMALVIGDVAGKGLEAATETAMVKYVLRAYLMEIDDPGQCLTKLNAALFHQLSMEKFITLWMAVIDLQSGRLSYSSAGHPNPLLCMKGANFKLESGQTLPVGVLQSQSFETTTRHISRGASLLMYTDGLIEARPPEAAPFGEQRAMQALSARCGQPAQKIAEGVRDAALDYSGGNLKDDIAVLVLRML